MKHPGVVLVQRTSVSNADARVAPVDGIGDSNNNETDLEELIEKREAWKHSSWATLMLAYGSLGVIYGDIGTSPMYALTSIFYSIPSPTQRDVLGGISLIFWAQTLIVLVKYVLIVLHANDHGEGGTFALYTRLCRVIGIGTTSSLDKAEHAKLLRTAAVAGEINRANKLARATRGLARMFQWGSKLWHHHNPAPSETVVKAAVAAAAAHDDHHDTGGKTARKTGLIHRWAFPAAPMKRWFQAHGAARGGLLAVSVLGTAMVVGDGVLTPAISVVSAVQGLEIKTDIDQNTIIGISVALLVGLFVLQSLGTHRIAWLFSPMVALWMLSIFAIGIYNLQQNGTTVLQGLSPHYIVTFFSDNGVRAWEALGGVMLTLTGAEALFADLGHFNIASVGVGFTCFVYPCIIVAYLGQGALVLTQPDALDHVFWSSVPNQYFWPMLVIATCTAVVASQALISGSFSIIRQAMTLGAFPPLHVVHTGEHVEGQIYIGTINYTLMLLSIAVVAGFGGSSTKIGNAYGIAVATVMVITTGLVVLVMLVDWEISALLVVPFAALYLVIECGFLSSNLIKVPDGGWFTFAVTAGVALIMFVWISGQSAKRKALNAAKHSSAATAITDILQPQISQPQPTEEYIHSSGPQTIPEEKQLSRSGSSGMGGLPPRPPRVSPGLGQGGAQLATMRSFASGRSASSNIYSHSGNAGAYDSGDRPSAAAAIRLSTRARRLGDDLQPMSSPGNLVSINMAALPSQLRGASSDRQALLPAPLSPRSLQRVASLQHTTAAVAYGSSPARRSSADGTKQQPPQQTYTPRESPPELVGRNLSKVWEEPDTKNASQTTNRWRTAFQSESGQGSADYGAGGASVQVIMESHLSVSTPFGDPGITPPALADTASPQPADGEVGVAKLRGIGVYYADNGEGIPPVMWHFLRNVEAVHEVVVLLQNQFLPIPYLNALPGVDETQRFGSCRPVAGVPHFYRVVARYGYMDVVDHGPEFVEHMKDYIKAYIKTKPLQRSASKVLDVVRSDSGVEEQTGVQEELNLLETAYEQGVVYYLGRTRLRMKKMNNMVVQVLHDTWYEALYKLLAVNCWDRSESWQVPANSLVEMAIVLEI